MSQILDLKIDSAALGRPVPVRLVTPPEWSNSGDRTWPVLYLLHGVDDDYTSWTRETDIAELAAEAGILVVMPDGGPAGFYSDWRRRDRGGTIPRWETFHMVELVTLLKRDYAAGRSWAIGGISMGGYGALRYAAKYPGRFRAAASYSGLLHTTGTGIPLFIAMILLRELEWPTSVWGWRRSVWRANDPYHLAAALRGTELYVSTGKGGPGGPGLLEKIVAATTEDFITRLGVLGIPATVNGYAGIHDWPYWRRELKRSWPLLAAALKR